MSPLVPFIIASVLLMGGAAVYFLGYSMGYRHACARASRLVCKANTIDPETKATLSAEILEGNDTEVE